ncbi:MAG: hypothetical protein EU529_16255 [Promethearchaeota archaeon]|nr:MAG: hypothetical protein EU529_16255 [Candidatus Lokiarchaeota archaeon]
MSNNIQNKLHFINISKEEMTLFEWKPPRSFKSYILDVNIVKENTTQDIFFHLNKGNMKLVYIRKGILLYTIGADQDVQYQILEALLEQIDKKFHEIWDIEVIFSYGNVSSNIFKDFTTHVNQIIEDVDDFIQKVDVYCRVCKKTLPLYVKKSIIEKAISFPVPLVFTHKGHALVTYIDQNFVVRGVELVNITG